LCLFPRGEVGAGVLVVSLSYGIGGSAMTIALLSLALNLLLTGVFIVGVKKLIRHGHEPREERPRLPKLHRPAHEGGR
jgi:hypothetical protein